MNNFHCPLFVHSIFLFSIIINYIFALFMQKNIIAVKLWVQIIQNNIH